MKAAPILLDATKLKAWLACPRRFQFGHLRHLEPVGAGSIHLVFGRAVHAGLEALENGFLRGMDREQALQFSLPIAYALQPPALFPDEATKTPESIARILIWYADQFYGTEDGSEVPPALRPIYNELPFSIHLDALVAAGAIHEGHLRRSGWHSAAALPNVALCGRFDSIVEGPSEGEFWVRDRKTTTRSLTDYYFTQYQPNLQISLYSWMARQIWPRWRIKGVLIEAIQVGTHFCRIIRKEFKPWPENLDDTVVEILAAILRMQEAGVLTADSAELPLLPPNEAACMSDGMPCSFRSLCNAHPLLRKEMLSTLYSTREPWSPLDEAGLPVITKLGLTG
jgi:PD-(D/E)XK nuclease superfamily